MDINKILPLKNWVGKVEDEFKSRGGAPKLSISDLPGFNRRIWGLTQKGLTIIGSRTSQGKTSLALQIAYNLSEEGNRVLYLSLEDDVEFLIERLFCNIMKVDNFSLISGGYNKNEEIRTKWETFKKTISAIPLMLTCGVGKDFKELLQIVEALEPKPKVVILDYIQNIARRNTESRETLNEYIRYYRELMIKYNMAGVICSQINRQAIGTNSSEPTLHTLKETGCLEETAEQVWLLHWDYFYSYDEQGRNIFKIIIAKNKRGKCGEYLLIYEPEFYRFSERKQGGVICK